MAEEQTKTAEAAPAPAPTADGPKETPKNNNNNKRGGKRDEKPIEELFDLSKPLPRVEKPKKEVHDAQLKEINDKFEKLKTQRRKTQDKIEATMNQGKGSEMGKLKESMVALRKSKGKLIDEKKAIRSKLDGLREKADKLSKDRKETRSNIKFTTEKEINAELKKLQRKQETTSMSLQDEKKLIKEIEQLKASKEKIKELTNSEAGIEDVKTQRKIISASIGEKDKEIDAVSKDIDELQTKIDAMKDKESSKRGALDGLFKERDKLKKEIAAILKEKDKLRDDFREKNNAWWNTQRAVKAQKKIQYEAEKAKREEERKEYLKKLEEEEAKKIPYEEEQALCDYLADYLERTYLNVGDDKKETKKDDVIAVKDDPFAGFKAMNKKGDEEEYFGKGKGKKKRQRNKKQDQAAAGPFTLSVDSFEQFGLIGLAPPTKLEMVEQSVKDLRAKKEWYKQQPRGSVPTAKDIRKQNERNAAKLRSNNTPTSSKPAPKGNFSLSKDDFAPLGKGASNAVDTSSWGQKPAAAVAAKEDTEEAAPAEE